MYIYICTHTKIILHIYIYICRKLNGFWIQPELDDCSQGEFAGCFTLSRTVPAASHMTPARFGTGPAWIPRIEATDAANMAVHHLENLTHSSITGEHLLDPSGPKKSKASHSSLVTLDLSLLWDVKGVNFSHKIQQTHFPWYFPP